MTNSPWRPFPFFTRNHNKGASAPFWGKICGILTESCTINGILNHILIGIGFNVNEEVFNEETVNIATSLKKEYHKNFSREEIIIKFIEIFEKKIEFIK